MAMLHLSSPWVIYYRELNELFKHDTEIKVIFDEDENVINVYVQNGKKADALMKLLPEKKEFGNVTLTINVIPANGVKLKESTPEDLIVDAFNFNPILSYVKVIRGIMPYDIMYVVFSRDVAQYFNDNLGDINGLCSTLYQDIANRVLNHIDGVFYCTEAA